MGWMTFQDGVAYSRNVVAAKVALRLGDTTRESSAALYDTWLQLGYGAPTGIDVAGEVAGIVRDPALTPWREIDLANGAFGQGVAVTPIQLAAAYATLANGGTLVHPHVVRVSAIATSRWPGDPGHRRRPVADPGQDDAARGDRSPVLPGSHARSRVRRRRQDRDGPDLGPKANDGKGAWKRNLFNYSFVGFIGRQTGSRPDRGDPDRRGHPDGRPGRSPEMPVMSFERSAGSRPTHHHPDLLPDRPTAPALSADR
jgi:hypothetical protein